MALYHLTVKNNRKPGRKGNKIKALTHVEYINREGKFKHHDEKEQLSIENIITSATKKDALDGTNCTLYKSPYGNIINTDHGVTVINDPSMDTIAIALMVSNETMHAPLIINGSDIFKAKCIVAAANSDLPITFADKKLQTMLVKKQEDLKNEQQQFRNSGGKIVRGGKSISQSDAYRYSRQISKNLTIGTLPSMHELLERNMVSAGIEQSYLLVQSNVHDSLYTGESEQDATLRRYFLQQNEKEKIELDYSYSRRMRACQTARTLIAAIEENMDKVYAASHVEYINREKAFAQKGGCVYKKNYLPKWASVNKKNEDGTIIKVPSPNVFFNAGDRYSDCGDRTFKEVEFALQNELTLEQNIEIVDQFIKENLPDHYYTYAIHDKIGMMSNGAHNIHVHLMFSPRLVDDVELSYERKRSVFFKRALKNNAKDQSFTNRRNHGAPKDRKWDRPEFINHIRESYAKITNETLKKYGYSIRVDHRSLKVQEEEARMNGDTLLADILHRIPEEHITRMGMLKENDSKIQRLKNYRKKKLHYQNMIYEAELLEESIQENDHDAMRDELEKYVNKIITSDEYQDVDSFSKELRENFIDVLSEYQNIRNAVPSIYELVEQAKLEYMTTKEKEIYQQLKEVTKELNGWKEFQENIQKTVFTSNDEEKAYNELLPVLHEKITKLENEVFTYKKQVAEIETKFAADDIKKNIQQIVHAKIQNIKHQQHLLEQAEHNLTITIKAISQALFSNNNEKTIFTYRELYKNIRSRYYQKRKAAERLKKQLAFAKKKVISIERATKIAENSYVHGAYKKLRADKVKLKDMAGKPEYDIIEYRKLKAQIENDETRLAKEISTEPAKNKIKTITASIMRKNSTQAAAYNKLNTDYSNLCTEIDKYHKFMNVLREKIISYPQSKRVFKIETTKLPISQHTKYKNIDAPGIIAAAIAGDKICMSIVASLENDDDKGMKANWKFLTELAQEEQQNKSFNNLI